MRFPSTLLSSLLLLFSLFASAAPYPGVLRSFKQPDGQLVDVRLFGNEYYMRAEGLDGYTLIRDKETGWVCYAGLSPDRSQLVSLGIRYLSKEGITSSLRVDLGVEKHLDISPEARQKQIKENIQRLNQGRNKEMVIAPPQVQGTPIFPLKGSIKGLCVLIDFSDEPATLPVSEFEAFCNDINYSNFGNKGSLRKFYGDISGGLIDYQNVVFGFYRAPLTFAQYDAMPYAEGAQQILGQALNWIKNLGFDFSTLTVDADSNIQAINMMYTGEPPNWAQGMWHHMGTFDSFSSNGVHSHRYNCSPANSPLGIGVVAHENGHMIGQWPDTYKYDSDHGPDGIDAFDLMCWYGSAENPVPPNPLFRSNAGWGKVLDISTFNGSIVDTSNDGTCYRYTNPSDTNEFFMIEARQKVGRSQLIPSEGLTIWHMDRNGDNQTFHHEVYLVHAGNNITSHGTACYRQGYKTEYSNATTPKSDWYNGDPSGLRVWNIGPKGAVMNYKIGLGAPGPFFRLQYINITDDDNGNGFPEPGEGFKLNVKALNVGQLSSGIAKMYCNATGSTASMVNISADTILLGQLQVSQESMAAFQISFLPGIPLGTEVPFKITITDGQLTTYITARIVAGYVVEMANDTVNACSAIFYDDGGTSNYGNNGDYIKTFFPSTQGDKVKINFTAFDVENGPGCGYDYLEVYDGPSLGYPALGVFCGSTSPDEIIATDTSGAITFLFHSDEGTTGSGWSAIVSCFSQVGTTSSLQSEAFKIYPTPASSYVSLQLPFGYSSEPVLVTDLLGKEVTTFASGKTERVYVGHLPSGVYVAKLKTENGSWQTKLVVQR